MEPDFPGHNSRYLRQSVLAILYESKKMAKPKNGTVMMELDQEDLAQLVKV
jgi:hypothetical protein